MTELEEELYVALRELRRIVAVEIKHGDSSFDALAELVIKDVVDPAIRHAQEERR